MLQIYSPSNKEEELALYLKDELIKFGFKNVRKDNVGNVVAEIGEKSPIIFFCGHMDTVPGFIPVRVEGQRIYGRGAADAKSSLAAMIMATSRFTNQPISGKIVLACVVDEEGRSIGIKELLKNREIQADFAIFGEPSGIRNITIGYKGALKLEVTVETPTSHASAPWLTENAILKSFELVQILQSHTFNNERKGEHYYGVSVTPTIIQGGSADNVIPGTCKLVIDIRIPPQILCEKALGEINGLIQNFQAKSSSIRVSLNILEITEAYEADKNSSFVRALQESVKDVLGETARLIRKTGTGDMNMIGRILRIPTVTYGPGNSHLDHSENEYIEIPEYLKSIEIYKRIVERLLSQGSSQQNRQM